jgi:uncharacterized membrane protein YeaQ/YmgE (transglycosylase-associated protein family)
MTLGGFLLLLLIAGICGSLAQTMAGYSHSGCLVSIALGFVGAVLGTWIAHQMGLPELLTIQVGGQPFPVVWRRPVRRSVEPRETTREIKFQ